MKDAMPRPGITDWKLSAECDFTFPSPPHQTPPPPYLPHTTFTTATSNADHRIHPGNRRSMLPPLVLAAGRAAGKP